MDLSVIIPCLNEKDTIGTCVTKALNQIKNLEGCWKAIEKETGIKGSPKMFRKTFYTYGGDQVGDDDMIILSDHKDKKTALDSYKKFTNAKRKRLADKVAKIFTFPRVVNE